MTLRNSRNSLGSFFKIKGFKPSVPRDLLDLNCSKAIWIRSQFIWSEWRLTVIAATVRIALVDILDLSEVDIPAGVFLHPAVGWG